ncbi:MAG: hypothetical protein AAGF12_21760 [Myxococcota bacterium]
MKRSDVLELLELMQSGQAPASSRAVDASLTPEGSSKIRSWFADRLTEYLVNRRPLPSRQEFEAKIADLTRG